MESLGCGGNKAATYKTIRTPRSLRIISPIILIILLGNPTEFNNLLPMPKYPLCSLPGEESMTHSQTAQNTIKLLHVTY